MNQKIITGMFFGMAGVLLLAVLIYTAVILPEVSEYNEHLEAIRYELERGNCSAGYVTVYPDYYSEELSHEEYHRVEGLI